MAPAHVCPTRTWTHPLTHANTGCPQAVDSGKEREELFEDWLDEKEKQVGRLWLVHGSCKTFGA